VDTANYQEDERCYIRHPVDIPIWVKSHKFPGLRTLPSNNISNGGLAFISHEPIGTETLIEITIRITQPSFHVSGLVKWCRSMNHGWEIGAQFISKEDAFRVRMIEQVCYIEQYKHDVVRHEGRRLSTEHAAREWIEKHASRFPTLPTLKQPTLKEQEL